MNIHPFFVHFPIALLTFYAIFECIQAKRLLAMREWLYLKALFLFLGSGGALLAAATGDFGKRLYRIERSVISVHETFAYGTIIIFGFICAIYLVMLVEALFGEKSVILNMPWRGGGFPV